MSRCHIKKISYIFSSSLELLILGMRIVLVHRQLGFDSLCSSVTPAGFFFRFSVFFYLFIFLCVKQYLPRWGKKCTKFIHF